MKCRIGLLIGAILILPATANAQAFCFGLGKFKTEQSDDRFSTNPISMTVGKNNRISKKSVSGGVHIDCSGVFIEPFVGKKPATGEIVGVGLLIQNYNAFTDFTVRRANMLGNLKRVAFLLGDGTLIAADIGSPKIDFGGGYGGSQSVYETGVADLTHDQYVQIMSATSLAVRLEGDQSRVTYESRDISKHFQTNLQTFYRDHIAGAR